MKYIPFTFILVTVIIFSLYFAGGYNNKDIVTQKNKVINWQNIDLIDENIVNENEILVVNFFASWCATCPYEKPYLKEIKNHIENNNLKAKLIGIAWQDDKFGQEYYMQEFGSLYQILLNDKSGINGIKFGTTGTPETYVIDNKGNILKHFIGAMNDEQMQVVLGFVE